MLTIKDSTSAMHHQTEEEEKEQMEGGKAEEYEVIEQIRRGPFGTTFLVLHKGDNKRCVMKKIRLSKQAKKFRKTAHQEMDLIASLRNPYIIEYKDAWVEKDKICIVTAFCEGSDMEDMIKKARGVLFSEKRICKWFTQLLLAVNYLHANRVIHRDIKCSNIFITKNDDLRLGDFGFAKLLNTKDLASSVVGTPNYMCPELLADLPYGYKSDIWSLGCCMFEIVSHHPAFRATTMAGLISKINRTSISPMPPVYSPTLKRLIKSMLRKNPGHRPNGTDILRNPHLEAYLAKSSNPSSFLLPINKEATSSTSKAPTTQHNGKLHSGSQKLELHVRKLLVQKKHREDVGEKLKMALSSVFDSSNADIKQVVETSSSRKEKTKKSICNGEDRKQDDPNKLLKQIQVDNAESHEQQDNEETNENEGRIEASEKYEQSNNGSEENDIKEEVKSGISFDVEGDEPEENTQVKQNGTATKNGEGLNIVNERAEALESLLELCANLVQDDKLDELAGILQPFGNESTSSRETTIWLTKSLISMPKYERLNK